MPAGLLGRDWNAIPTSSKVVALTFDGGANADALPSILQTLRDEGVRATFFVTGDFAQRYPAQVQQIAAGGHVIGNHTMTHPELTTLSAAQVEQQVDNAAAAIAAAGGGDPEPWFRFPFGDRDQTAIDRVNALGYICVGWTVDTLGWQGTSGGRTADSVVQRVTGAARPGEIVLMHVGSHPQDGSTLDADALPQLIASLRGLGYGFTTVSAFLG